METDTGLGVKLGKKKKSRYNNNSVAQLKEPIKKEDN